MRFFFGRKEIAVLKEADCLAEHCVERIAIDAFVKALLDDIFGITEQHTAAQFAVGFFRGNHRYVLPSEEVLNAARERSERRV